MSSSSTSINSINVKALFLVILATVFWSTSGVFISQIIQNSGMKPVALAFWRDLTTCLTLFVGIAILKPKLLVIKRQDIPWLFAMGVSIGAFHVLWTISVMLNGAAISTVIQSDSPIFVTIMAWIFFKEPLTKRKFIAIALSIIGTVLISGLAQGLWTAGNGTPTKQITAQGLLVALAFAIMYGCMSLFGKKIVGSYSSWTVLLYTFGVGALFLLPFQFTIPLPQPISRQVLLHFTGLILITTISGFAVYTTALKNLEASIASITNTSEVAFAAILAYIFLGERLDLWQFLGALLVVSGVILVSLSNNKEKQKLKSQPVLEA